MTPWEDLTDEERGRVMGVLCDGVVSQRALQQKALRRVLDFGGTDQEIRYTTRLTGRLKIWGQDVSACSVTPGESHAPEDDVWFVQEMKEVKTRGSLTWTTTTSVTPTAPRLLLVEGGGLATGLPSCEPHVEGEKPSGWDESSDSVTTTYEDSGLLTGADLSAAAKAGEVELFDSKDHYENVNPATFRAPLASFARRHGYELGLSFESRCTGAGVRRFTFDMRVTGHKIPFTLKWDEREDDITVAGTTLGTPTTHEQHFSAATGWSWLLEEDYPASGKRKVWFNFRVITV